MGALAGALAEVDRSLPFVLTLALCAMALFLSLKVWQIKREEEAPSAGNGVAL
jgi:cytochrome oxidase assembly protein ShyY1